MELTEEIQKIRATFQQELPGKQASVHAKDLERWTIDDKWVQRFLLQHDKNQKEALKMVWITMKWRKEFGANNINDVVNMDIVLKGDFFAHGYDKDGSILFVLKLKSHTKGSTPIEELKKVIVYWLERLERQEHQNPITLFFDMEGCGLANVDMELTRNLISLFRNYYPNFLNYIIIFEMPWVLNAAFNIIKSLLSEKAVQKLKFLSKKDIGQFVPLDQALVCWGGSDTYTFSFIPENDNTNTTSVASCSKR